MEDFEKLGIFYLGKVVSPGKKSKTDHLFLYDSKNFTTHAVTLGMTGSGKTGLGIALLEEAALDKIPSIVIDPKGDLGNLLLTFPNLDSKDFLPWIDEEEAERKKMTPDTYAAALAKEWKNGLEKWREGPERIQKLNQTVEKVIYTPASQSGLPLSILNSFAAPPKEEMKDKEAVLDRVLSTTSSLLGLIGIQADPIKSREHILISSLILTSWQNETDLDLGGLIQQIQNPPFSKIGALDIDTFFSKKERTALSVKLNNLLASPGFHAWMEGDPLDIQKLLYTQEGKPKISVISIAHLSDPERMFFVTLLLNEFLFWMRRQSGTSSLRAILYMDEIFGFFPPVATPPSKLPMLTLLKTARAFGVGVVLATQNPVDLDYKGLSNCGTWFIGKLQTERDKSRVVEGLKVASKGDIDTKTLNKLLASTGNRTFILNSIYEKAPLLFQTRWTLSYLRGPLTLPQIESLTQKKRDIPAPLPKKKVTPKKPQTPAGVSEYFVQGKGEVKKVHYKPFVGAFAKMHFVDAKNKIDVWKEFCTILPPSSNGKTVDWDKGKDLSRLKSQLKDEPLPESTFDELPPALRDESTFTQLEKALVSSLYQNQTLKIYRVKDLNLISKPEESEGDFGERVRLSLREKRDKMVEQLKKKYAQKISALSEKIRRAENIRDEKQEKAQTEKAETLLSAGETILGVLFGRKRVSKGTIKGAGTTMRRAGRIGRSAQDIGRAEEEIRNYQTQLEALQDQLKKEIDQVPTLDQIEVETLEIRPRKNDISVEQIFLVWLSSSN